MNIPLFIAVLFLLQILCLYVGKKASKELKTQDDYFLAGRGIRFFPLLMTLIATQIGGGLVLGSAEEAYKYGWNVLLYPLGASLGLLALASGIGKRMSQFKVSTVAQLFEVVYQSIGLKKVASGLSIISLFMILIAQVIASRKFMISLGVDNEWLFLAFWAIVIVYTVAGGLKAVVATDIIQAVFFIVVFLLAFVFTYFSGIPVAESTALNTETFEFSSTKLCGWLLMPLLFMVIEQDMAQRCFAAKSGKVVSLASGVAAVCIMLVCAIPVFYGIAAKTMGLTIPSGGSVFMSAIQATTTPAIMALVGCAILAAIISTADSLINAISSNVAQDFDFAWKKKASSMKISQLITTGIGCAAMLGSFYASNVVDVLIQSYELSVSCLFVSITAALFVKKGDSRAATYSVTAGAAAFVYFLFIPATVLPKEVTSVMISAVGYGVGLLQTYLQARQKALLEN